MIAAQRALPEPRIERVRDATVRRARRTRRRLHAPVHAVVTLVVIVFVPLLAYAALTANLTSLNDKLATASIDRGTLLERTQRLDERIARLQSPDRLAALAGTLRMHDPHVYAVVRIPDPKPVPKPTGLALFAWFNTR